MRSIFVQCFRSGKFCEVPVLLLLLFLSSASTVRGDVTYSLTFDPASSSEAQVIADSVEEAVDIINTYGSFNKHWTVYYNPSVPTAEANYSGYMAFGGTRNTRVVFHEGAHTFGMGTTTAYANLISSGVWAGEYGNQAQFDTYNDYADGLHGDGHAIWPGGFNYDDEDGELERIWMLRIMAGIRCDMGILAYNKEAENELVHPGEVAEFSVESPVANSYQWYKNGVALSNGDDISGANEPTLRIANAEAADQGTYYCAATGAGETLNSRPRQLFVEAEEQLLQLDLDGSVADSVNTNHATFHGSASYVTGKSGQAIDLDGSTDYIELPGSAVRSKDVTVATWVHWDGGSNWQRIFDFGTGSSQYMFLTPKSGSGTLRLAFRDAINGVSAEQRVETSVLPTGQWVHLAAVLKAGYATLYVNGEAVGSTAVPVTDLVDFLPTQNYIGKSQFSDPLFNGRIDDFRVYNHALSGADVWALWGESTNQPPVFAQEQIVLPDAVAQAAYTNASLSSLASDAEDNVLSFEKVAGPDWVSVASSGALSGTPEFEDQGTNVVYVRVADSSGASVDAEVRIFVGPPAYDFESGPVAYWNFSDAGAVAGGYLPGNGERADLDNDGAMDLDDFRIGAADLSGNGNHLTAWSSSWMKWSTESALGNFSMTYNNHWPAAGTDSSYNPHITGIDVEAITPAQWTIEAQFNCYGANWENNNQTIVGRDGYHVGGNSSAAAALYLSIRGTELAIAYTDVSGVSHVAQTSGLGLQYNQWYDVAAVSDGEQLQLWVNGSVAAQTALSGADTSLGLGHGMWSVARGMYDNGHVDRFNGAVDAVAISGVALEPSDFVIKPLAAPSGLTATSGDAQVELSWNAVEHATGYLVYAGEASGGPYESIVSAEPHFVHTNLQNGTLYYYTVSAERMGAEGPASQEISAVPSVAISPAEYLISSHTVQSGTHLTLSVSNAVPGHTYRILKTDDLTAPDWQPTGSALTGSGSRLSFEMPIDALSTNRYYKLDVERL